jgi:hypothetical protein
MVRFRILTITILATLLFTSIALAQEQPRKETDSTLQIQVGC